MNLPPEAIIEYQQIHRKEFGEELSYEEAEKTGIKLLSFFKLITTRK